MAAMHYLEIFCERKNSKIEVRNNVQVILKWPPQLVDFLNICDRKKTLT